MFGMTAKTVSPTRPRDVDETPAALTATSSPSLWEADEHISTTTLDIVYWRTFEKDSIECCDERPGVGGPVSMIEASGEREKTGEELRELPHNCEWAEGNDEYRDHSVCKSDKLGKSETPYQVEGRYQCCVVPMREWSYLEV